MFKIERKLYGAGWGAGVVICLERGADLHMAQLMPLPLTVSCLSKIQIGFTFLVPAHLGSPGKGPLNGCVCTWVSHYRKGKTNLDFTEEREWVAVVLAGLWQSALRSRRITTQAPHQSVFCIPQKISRPKHLALSYDQLSSCFADCLKRHHVTSLSNAERVGTRPCDICIIALWHASLQVFLTDHH